jgi:hypothetical protein
MTEKKPTLHVAHAAYMGSQSLFGESNGTFYMPYGDYNASLGLTPEKLVVPKDYHQVVRMCYDFYQRGGIVATVVNRLAEFTITEIRNGQRDTSDEINAYYSALLRKNPSRLMRFLRQMALEYYLTGMVLPKVDWEEKTGAEISPDLRKSKVYEFPSFDLYPPLLVDVRWAGWGQKSFWLKIPEKDIRLIRNRGSRIKEQQLKYQQWADNYPSFVNMIINGADSYEIKDSDPILRKEISISPYPTPYLFPVLEPLIFKQQLRRMDFAVASRVINAILLVKEGSDDFPLTEENSGNLDKLKEQIQARAGNPLLMERLFMLFTNHTTSLEWITPDIGALLNRDKYQQINEELEDGLGFTTVLLTGESRQAQASEVSTWAIQPQMEEFRSMAIEWMTDLYKEAKDRNSFSKVPAPKFTPIKLQDYVKTAAVFAALFGEGNVSRTTRDEMAGIDLETETELMKDEQKLLKGLPAFVPTPYSPAPPIMGENGKPGRPIGSQNVPVNNRNSGVKPKGQKPLSKVKAENEWYTNNIELMADEDVIELMTRVAQDRGIIITADDVIDKD